MYQKHRGRRKAYRIENAASRDASTTWKNWVSIVKKQNLWHMSMELSNQILFSFSSDKDRRTDNRIRRKKHSAAPPGIEPRILRILVARSNHWATKPQRELRVNFRLSPSCQFFFLIRLSVLLSLSELKEKRIWLGISRQERVYDSMELCFTLFPWTSRVSLFKGPFCKVVTDLHIMWNWGGGGGGGAWSAVGVWVYSCLPSKTITRLISLLSCVMRPPVVKITMSTIFSFNMILTITMIATMPCIVAM